MFNLGSGALHILGPSVLYPLSYKMQTPIPFCGTEQASSNGLPGPNTLAGERLQLRLEQCLTTVLSTKACYLPKPPRCAEASFGSKSLDRTLQFQPAPQSEPFRPNLNDSLMCPEGNDNNIIEELSSKDAVCGDCGLVPGDRIIDTRSECRTFADNEGGYDPCRVGAVADPFLHDSQLDAITSSWDGCSDIAKELQRVQTKSATKIEIKPFKVYDDIDAMGGAIGLPKTTADMDKQVYKKMDDSEALKKRLSTQSIIAACIIIECGKQMSPERSRKFAL